MSGIELLLGAKFDLQYRTGHPVAMRLESQCPWEERSIVLGYPL